jgi:hypothetical protein
MNGQRSIVDRIGAGIAALFWMVMMIAVIAIVATGFAIGVKKVTEVPKDGGPSLSETWWQNLGRERAERDCTMGALQSSDRQLYYQLCMQQKGFDQ